jgi:hypothetical protein
MMEARMKKLLSFFSVIAATVSYFSLAASAYAATSLCPTGQFANLCNLKLNSSSPIVGRIITILLIVAIVLALFFLIWGSIRWIMSGGDKSKLESARGTIVAALVGLILAFLAFFFLNVITFLFTKNTITNFNIPTIVP